MGFEPGQNVEDLEKFLYTVGKVMMDALIAANNMGVHPTTILKKHWSEGLDEAEMPPIRKKAVQFIVDFVSMKSGEMAPKWLKGLYKDRPQKPKSRNR